jgi:plastocyanin
MLAARSTRLATAALVAAFALSACGETTRIKPSAHATARPVGSVKPTVFPSPTKSVAPSPTASGTVAPTASPTGGGGGGNEVKATAANKFDPASLKVKVGTKVTWTAQGYHTVTSGENGTADPAGPMKGQGGFKTYSVTFDKAGTFKYFCVPHVSLGMTGEIVVS